MHQPLGFKSTNFPSHVCRLHKALYGLKQVPKAWFHKLSTYLLNYGFQCSRADPSLFFYHTATNILMLLVYIDNILIIRSNLAQVLSLINHLSPNFAIQDSWEIFLESWL